MKVNKIQLQKLLREGYNDTECAQILNVHPATVSWNRNKMRIEKNFSYSSKVDKDKLLELYSRGLSDMEISKELGTCKSIGVYYWRTKLGLKANPKRFPKHTISKEQHQILIGTLMGDGCLTKVAINTRLDFAHTIKQQDWFLWKYERLKPFVWDYKIRTYNHIRYKSPITEIRAKSRVHPLLNSYYKEFYPSGKKIVPRELFKQITPLGLAVWFMDDGTKGSISTNSFTSEDIDYIIQVLDIRFGIKSSRRADNTLGILKSGNSFYKLIEPYIIPSMKYKLSL